MHAIQPRDRFQTGEEIRRVLLKARIYLERCWREKTNRQDKRKGSGSDLSQTDSFQIRKVHIVYKDVMHGPIKKANFQQTPVL